MFVFSQVHLGPCQLAGRRQHSMSTHPDIHDTEQYRPVIRAFMVRRFEFGKTRVQGKGGAMLRFTLGTGALVCQTTHTGRGAWLVNGPAIRPLA